MDIPHSINALLHASRELERAGDVPAAIRQAQAALILAQQSGDGDAQGFTAAALAYAHIRLGHYAVARALLEQALPLTGMESPARGEVLLTLGICAAETDDIIAAEDFFQKTIDLGRQLGVMRLLVRGLHSLAAGVYTPRGEFSLAIAADEEALKLARVHNFPELIWSQLTNLTWTCWVMGQRERTLHWLTELREIALPGTLADGYWYLVHGELAREDGDFVQARARFAAVRSFAEAKGLVELDLLVRLALARLCRAEGGGPDAFTWAADALKIAERIGYRHIQGRALIERGRAAWDLGHLAEAAEDFRAALAVLTPLRAHFDEARATLLLAGVLAMQEAQDALKAQDAPTAWAEAATRLLDGGYIFLVEQERALTLPLIAVYANAADVRLQALAERLLEQLARTPPPALQISLLGGFTVRQGAREIERRALRQRRAGELLALLLLTPEHSLSFEQVAEALWPEKNPSTLLALFHQATSALRRALEPDLPDKFPSRYLSVDEGQVTLNVPPDSRIDFEIFEAYCRKREWEAALTFYSGDLLPEYLYADWAAIPRQRFSQQYQRVLLATAEARLAAGLFQEALEACQRLLAIEPWQEQAVSLGMRASLRLHDRAGALRLYLDLERALCQDLGLAPQPELQRLFQSIK